MAVATVMLAEAGAFGITLGLSAGLAPGPLTALVIAQTLRYGRGEGFRIALAPLLTDLPIVIVSVTLLALVRDSATLLAGLGAIGALYLLWIAIETWGASLPQASGPAAAPASWRRGMLTNFLNPHPYLFWATLGAPYVIGTWRASPAAAASFVVGFYALLVGAKLALAVLIATQRKRFTPAVYRIVMRVLALALVLFALRLLRDAASVLTG